MRSHIDWSNKHINSKAERLCELLSTFSQLSDLPVDPDAYDGSELGLNVSNKAENVSAKNSELPEYTDAHTDSQNDNGLSQYTRNEIVYRETLHEISTIFKEIRHLCLTSVEESLETKEYYSKMTAYAKSEIDRITNYLNSDAATELKLRVANAIKNRKDNVKTKDDSSTPLVANGLILSKLGEWTETNDEHGDEKRLDLMKNQLEVLLNAEDDTSGSEDQEDKDNQMHNHTFKKSSPKDQEFINSHEFDTNVNKEENIESDSQLELEAESLGENSQQNGESYETQTLSFQLFNNSKSGSASKVRKPHNEALSATNFKAKTNFQVRQLKIIRKLLGLGVIDSPELMVQKLMKLDELSFDEALCLLERIQTRDELFAFGLIGMPDPPSIYTGSGKPDKLYDETRDRTARAIIRHSKYTPEIAPVTSNQYTPDEASYEKDIAPIVTRKPIFKKQKADPSPSLLGSESSPKMHTSEPFSTPKQYKSNKSSAPSPVIRQETETNLNQKEIPVKQHEKFSKSNGNSPRITNLYAKSKTGSRRNSMIQNPVKDFEYNSVWRHDKYFEIEKQLGRSNGIYEMHTKHTSNYTNQKSLNDGKYGIATDTDGKSLTVDKVDQSDHDSHFRNQGASRHNSGTAKRTSVAIPSYESDDDFSIIPNPTTQYSQSPGYRQSMYSNSKYANKRRGSRNGRGFDGSEAKTTTNLYTDGYMKGVDDYNIEDADNEGKHLPSMRTGYDSHDIDNNDYGYGNHETREDILASALHDRADSSKIRFDKSRKWDADDYTTFCEDSLPKGSKKRLISKSFENLRDQSGHLEGYDSSKNYTRDNDYSLIHEESFGENKPKQSRALDSVNKFGLDDSGTHIKRSSSIVKRKTRRTSGGEEKKSFAQNVRMTDANLQEHESIKTEAITYGINSRYMHYDEADEKLIEDDCLTIRFTDERYDVDNDGNDDNENLNYYEHEYGNHKEDGYSNNDNDYIQISSNKQSPYNHPKGKTSTKTYAHAKNWRQ